MKKGRSEREQEIIDRVFSCGQGHLLGFWDELKEEEKDLLIKDIGSVDFDLIEKVKPLLKSRKKERAEVKPPEVIKIASSPGLLEQEKRAREAGERYLKNGKVAVFTAAGGQSSRLGIDIPKGAYPVTPIRKKSLFQVHAEKIHFIQGMFDVSIPWIIMVSETNRDQTIRFFESNGFFGLKRRHVSFIEQDMFPALDDEGRIFLREKHRLFLSPTGHGGTFSTLRKSGTMKRLEEMGIEEIFYFQVDNVLVKVLDPVFIGYHVLDRCQMSSKSVFKSDPKEKIGVFVVKEGRTQVIEYFEVWDLVSQDASFDSSSLTAGNIAIHMINLRFIDEETKGGLRLPLHIAHKKISCIDSKGDRVEPQKENGYKTETFIFDALKDAERTIVMEVKREDEFSPLKNRTGVDSPQTVLRDQVLLFARWFEGAGISVLLSSDGIPVHRIEVSPRFAAFAEEFRKKIDRDFTLHGDTYIE